MVKVISITNKVKFVNYKCKLPFTNKNLHFTATWVKICPEMSYQLLQGFYVWIKIVQVRVKMSRVHVGRIMHESRHNVSFHGTKM